MAFNLDLFVRGLHILFASVWAGSALFMAFRIGLTLKAAGPAAGPFMLTMLRRGGMSTYFLTMAVLAILTGGYTYHAMGFDSAPFGSTSNILLTVGAIVAILAVLHGATALAPAEHKVIKMVRAMPPGPPSPEMAAKLQAFGERQGKHSAISAMMIAVALILMAMHMAF